MINFAGARKVGPPRLGSTYLQRGELSYGLIEGFWIDAGESHEALLKANITIARHQGVDIR